MANPRFQYSTQQLVNMRSSASSVKTVAIDMFEDIDPSVATKIPEKAPVPQNTVIRFRKVAASNEIKFVEDMDVPVTQIIHAYNLSDLVTWPVLKTFCEKTVGVPAFDIRMMRRKKPAEARLIFRTQEEANSFLANVPQVSLKGRTPKFEMETTAPKHSPKTEELVVCTVLEPVSKPVVAKASPVVCTPEDMPVAVAQISTVEQDDDCCAKSAKVKEVQPSSQMVMSAVALDTGKMSAGKQGRAAHKSPQGASRSVKRGPSGRAGKKAHAGTIVGISLDTLRRHSSVDLDEDFFTLDTNIQV